MNTWESWVRRFWTDCTTIQQHAWLSTGMMTGTHTVPTVMMLICAYAFWGLWCIILYCVWFSKGNSPLWLRISSCECCSWISLFPRQHWLYGWKKRVRGKSLLLCHVFVTILSNSKVGTIVLVALSKMSSTDVYLRSFIFAYCIPFYIHPQQFSKNLCHECILSVVASQTGCLFKGCSAWAVFHWVTNLSLN